MTLSKRYGTQRTLSEFPDNGWKLGSIDSLLKRIHKTGKMSGKQTVVGLDRVRRVAVKDLMLSQQDKPKCHRSYSLHVVESISDDFNF